MDLTVPKEVKDLAWDTPAMLRLLTKPLPPQLDNYYPVLTQKLDPKAFAVYPEMLQSPVLKCDCPNCMRLRALHATEESKRLPGELKVLWLRALRSGSYRQCAGRFQTYDGSFCALGLLMHVAGPGFVLDRWVAGSVQKTIAEMNDHGASFFAIARWVEQNL